MSVSSSTKICYKPIWQRDEPVYWEKLFRVHATPKNLKNCIRLNDPFLYRFSDTSQGRSWAYSPFEYAIKLNDIESLQYLFNLPDSASHFSIADAFFYIDCLEEGEAPNLEVLSLLLDHVPEVSSDVFYFVPDERVGIFGRYEIGTNLLDFACRHMGDFERLQVDVIEELFKRGVKVSEVRKIPPFALASGVKPFTVLKGHDYLGLRNPLLTVLTTRQFDRLSDEEDTLRELASLQVPSLIMAKPKDDSNLILQILEKIEVFDRGDVKLNRLCQYLKLERKYDPQPSSFLTQDEFKQIGCLYELKMAFKCVKVCSRFFDFEEKLSSREHCLFVQVSPSLIDAGEEDILWESHSSDEVSLESSSSEEACKGNRLRKSEIPFGLFVSSKEEESSESSMSEEMREWMLFTEENGWGQALEISLGIFYSKVVMYSEFFNLLVNKGTFEDCFKKHEIRDITATMGKIMERFPLDKTQEHLGCREEIVSVLHARFRKV